MQANIFERVARYIVEVFHFYILHKTFFFAGEKPEIKC